MQVRLLQQGVGRLENTLKKELLHFHAVERQSAGFVGTDDRCRAQGLNRWQMAYQCVAPGHALGRHGQRESHGGQQALRHVGDDNPDGKNEIFPEGQAQHLADKEKQHPQPDR